MTAYLHGFIPEEQQRLMDQAGVLESLIYPRIDFFGCKKLLEIGSGVGAQTETLLRLFPDLEITCVDYSQSQLDRAKQNLAFAGLWSIFLMHTEFWKELGHIYFLIQNFGSQRFSIQAFTLTLPLLG